MRAERALRTAMAAPLVALVAAASGAGPQTLRPSDPDQLRHVAAVRAERTTALLDAWVAAGPAARERVARYFEERAASRPAAGRPGFAELGAAFRLLATGEDDRPGEDGTGGALGRFADSLDLQVVPGAFAPAAPPAGPGEREGGDARGTPLRALAWQLFPASLAEDVTLRVLWVAPDGTETTARSEPFAPTAFRPPGATLFLRAPLSGPGTWHLVPEVRLGGRVARGAAVPVECAEAARGEHGGLLLTRGVRSPEARAIPGAEPVRSWRDGPFDPQLRPVVQGPGRSGGSLVLPAPEDEPAHLLFAGETGARWQALARAHGLRLVALEVRAAEGARFAEGLRALAAEGGPVVLVARADTVRLVAWLAASGELACDALVLAARRAPVPPSLGDLPVLVVERAPAGEPEPDGPRVRRVEMDQPFELLEEPELPDAIDAWLEGEVLPTRSGGGDR